MECNFIDRELVFVDDFDHTMNMTKISLFFSLEKEKKNLIEDLAIMKNQYADCNNELLRLQDIIDRLQADKGKLSRRVSKLVHNGKGERERD